VFAVRDVVWAIAAGRGSSGRLARKRVESAKGAPLSFVGPVEGAPLSLSGRRIGLSCDSGAGL